MKGEGEKKKEVALLSPITYTLSKLRVDKQILLMTHNDRSADTENFAIQI